LKFKDHPERFYSDRTIKVYSQAERDEEERLKQVSALKKRNKKLHRKELIAKLENKCRTLRDEEDKYLTKVQKTCRFAIWTATSASKMAIMSLGMYAVQAFANTQFNGQIPPASEFVKNLLS